MLSGNFSPLPGKIGVMSPDIIIPLQPATNNMHEINFCSLHLHVHLVLKHLIIIYFDSFCIVLLHWFCEALIWGHPYSLRRTGIFRTGRPDGSRFRVPARAVGRSHDTPLMHSHLVSGTTAGTIWCHLSSPAFNKYAFRSLTLLLYITKLWFSEYYLDKYLGKLLILFSYINIIISYLILYQGQ